MIRKEKDKYTVYSHDGKKKLGTYSSKKEAEERLKQIEIIKNIKEKKPK